MGIAAGALRRAVPVLAVHGRPRCSRRTAGRWYPSGTSTCQRPGSGPSDCGAGITSGEPLAFQLTYSSGTAATDEQEAAIQSSEAQAGVKLNLKSEPFNTLVGTVGVCTAARHPASTCGWQLVDYGYDPYSLYPTGTGFFDTGAPNNQGGYSNPEMDKLINATEYGSSTQALLHLRGLRGPPAAVAVAADRRLHPGVQEQPGQLRAAQPVLRQPQPQAWYYTK